MTSLLPFTTDLAIDLGTANTSVAAPHRGLVVNEPTVVAFNTRDESIAAVGAAAHAMVGKTPSTIVTVRPLRDGAIADFDATGVMLDFVIRKANPRRTWGRRRFVIGVPSGITPVERRAVEESAHRAKASRVHLVDEGMAGAIGAGMPVRQARGCMIVDIGGGTTDIAIISRCSIVYAKSLRIAGNQMDEAIQQYLRRNHNLLVGERTAERVKIEIGSAAPLERSLAMKVKGRHLIEGVPCTISLSDADVRSALGDSLRAIVDAVQHAIEAAPPEIASDIYDRGLVLTGGGSLLRNLDDRLRRETELPVQMTEDAFSSVALGAGHLLEDQSLLREIEAA